MIVVGASMGMNTLLKNSKECRWWHGHLNFNRGDMLVVLLVYHRKEGVRIC